MNYSSYSEAYDTSRINLEPRLTEYLRVKKINEENNIIPHIPAEQQFSITKDDMKTIKRYRKGKSMYSKSKVSKMDHFVTPEQNMDFFSNNAKFEDDPRYERLRKKIESNKKARSLISNYEGMDEDYTIFHKTNPYDNERPNKISKPYDDPSTYGDDDYLYGSGPSSFDHDHRYDERSVFMNSKDIVERGKSKYRYNPNDRRQKRSSEISYHHKPRIAYKQSLIPQQPNGGLDHDHSIDNIIGHLDQYNKHLDSTYTYIEDNYKYVQDTHDDFHKHNRRSKRRNGKNKYVNDMRYGSSSTNTSKDSRENAYMNVPLGYGAGLADISVENSLRGGIKDSRRKTTGFKNSFEHQFDFIDGDIAEPIHSVQMYPVNTRGTGKVVARPESRAMKARKRIEKMQDKQYSKYLDIDEIDRELDSGYYAADRSYDDYIKNRHR